MRHDIHTYIYIYGVYVYIHLIIYAIAYSLHLASFRKNYKATYNVCIYIYIYIYTFIFYRHRRDINFEWRKQHTLPLLVLQACWASNMLNQNAQTKCLVRRPALHVKHASKRIWSVRIFSGPLGQVYSLFSWISNVPNVLFASSGYACIFFVNYIISICPYHDVIVHIHVMYICVL